MQKNFKQICGQRIKAGRTDLKMTARELGNAVGLTEQSISAYNRADNYPQPESLEKIAKELNVDMAYLAGFDDHEFYNLPFHQPLPGQQPAFKIRRDLLGGKEKDVIQYQCQQNSYGLRIGDTLLINTQQTHGDGLFLVAEPDRPPHINDAPLGTHTVGKVIAVFHLYA